MPSKEVRQRYICSLRHPFDDAANAALSASAARTQWALMQKPKRRIFKWRFDEEEGEDWFDIWKLEPAKEGTIGGANEILHYLVKNKLEQFKECLFEYGPINDIVDLDKNNSSDILMQLLDNNCVIDNPNEALSMIRYLYNQLMTNEAINLVEYLDENVEDSERGKYNETVPTSIKIMDIGLAKDIFGFVPRYINSSLSSQITTDGFTPHYLTDYYE